MRLVLTSDTHRKEGHLIVPKGDILIHAGDFDVYKNHHLVSLDKWFSKIKAGFKKIIFIGGNHDFYLQESGHKKVQQLVTNATYLQDSEVVVDGIKFYGSPWTPIFFDWAFMLDEEGLKERYDRIPNDTDVLITHGPAYGILDQVYKTNGDFDKNVGSFALKEAIKRIQPKIHVCGHIHCGFGKYTDYKTNYYNVSFVDEMYQPTNEPTVVDIYKLKDGTVEVV